MVHLCSIRVACCTLSHVLSRVVVMEHLGSTLVLYLCCVVVCSYFFLEFANSEQAEQAVKASNGYRLDKSHIFVVNHFSDFDK